MTVSPASDAWSIRRGAAAGLTWTLSDSRRRPAWISSKNRYMS